MSLPHPARMANVDAIFHDPLLLPPGRVEFMVYTILAGQNLKAGSVLGRITASGKLKLCASAAGDGSEVPMAVLGEAISTYEADGTTPKDMKMSVIVQANQLNETALIFGAGHTIATTRENLRGNGILTRAPGFSG